MIVVNKLAPDFSLPATDGAVIRLADLRGKNVVLYFYPKDCTSGCTQEGREFSECYPQFVALDTVVFGVSRDTLRLHQKFKTEQQFPFELLADTEQKACHDYDVLKEKMRYGRKTRGIERSTFLIDKEGILRHEWRNVRVPGHAQAVLQAVKALTNSG